VTGVIERRGERVEERAAPALRRCVEERELLGGERLRRTLVAGEDQL
jgi:hypothetical protein